MCADVALNYIQIEALLQTGLARKCDILSVALACY